MTGKIRSKQDARPRPRHTGGGRGRGCRLSAIQAHMRRLALTRRGAAAAASALTLASAGANAQAAAAEIAGGEDAAVATACQTATERATQAIKGDQPLSQQAPGRSHASRKGRHHGKVHGRSKRVSHQAVVTVPGWNTVITDSIGPYTEVLLTNSEGAANCLVGPNPSEPPNGISESSGGEPTSVGADQIGGFTLGAERARDFKPFSWVAGRAGSSVSAVRFTLHDGTHVSAKLAHGWFLAFWEGLRHAATVEIVSASGTSTKKFYDPTAHEF